MLGWFLLFILLGVVPFILGLPWTKIVFARNRLSFSYGCGFFIELALFHIVTICFECLETDFHIITILYSVVLFLSLVASAVLVRKYGNERERLCLRILHFNWLEWCLIASITFVIGIQLVRGITYDITYMSYDDVAYTPIATDALEVGTIGRINPYTGEATTLYLQRAIQTSLVFPAYLSKISEVSVSTIEHTVQYIQFVLLAYIIYNYLAGELFEKRENRLLFILLVAVFYFFGYHSHYSLTFRLLGPNYQGKAVLAVSLTPFILTLLIRELKQPYNNKVGILLLLLSLSGVSLTLWSCGTIIVIISLPIIISLFRKGRNWRHLLYIAWGCIAPIVFSIPYLLSRYAN